MKDLALLILRAGAGLFIIINHGLMKVQALMSGGEIKFADPLGFGMGTSMALSAFAEFLCAGLLVLGLFPRVSAGILAFNMFVAGVIHHAADPLAVKESALLYLIVFISLLILGAGKYSINQLLPAKFRKY
ncbi:MAG: DoxX family protein [Ignavibacterium sp.]|nr:DoxX family protein [Ignavibacterium sp.]